MAAQSLPPGQRGGHFQQTASFAREVRRVGRAAFGVYILPDGFVGKMSIAQLRRSKVIYTHEAALFLRDLTDPTPSALYRRGNLAVYTQPFELSRLQVACSVKLSA